LLGTYSSWGKYTNNNVTLPPLFYILVFLGQLYVPKSFRELNTSGIKNGHILPSDIWPSDHLAIGARFRIKGGGQNTVVTMPNMNMAGSGMLCMFTNETDEKTTQLPQSQLVNGVEVENTKLNSSTTKESQASDDKASKIMGIPQAPPAITANPLLPTAHGQRCDCGCVPNVLSMFEMAALRKKYREEQKKKEEMKKLNGGN